MNRFLLSFLFCLCSIHASWSQTDLFDHPPMDKAEIFAPDLVSSPDKEHGKLTVAPDGKNMYWDYLKRPRVEGQVQKIACCILTDGKWSARKVAEFSGRYQAWSPCFRGNDKIIFGTKMDVGIDSVELVSEYWLIERQNEGWSQPQPLGFAAFSETMKWTFSVAENGNIYFDDKNYTKGQYGWGMYVSYYRNGEYSRPMLLPEHLNTEDFDWTPFIAPNESYLLFASNRPGSMGSTDIYISYKTDDGVWTDPVNMGDRINSKDLERWPSVSPDGRILFFQRDYIVDEQLKEQDYYWIDAKIIEELKPENLRKRN